MKCCDCYNYGPVSPEEALDDRLYWVEVLTGSNKGGRFTAWRGTVKRYFPWVISDEHPVTPQTYKDSEIRIIHEITPED